MVRAQDSYPLRHGRTGAADGSSNLPLATKAFGNGSLFFFKPMDTFVVYILYSTSSGRTYTGMTSDFITRFHFHNSKSTKGFTLRYRPWTVIHVEFFDLKKDALFREKELKSGKGREWLKQHILPFYR